MSKITCKNCGESDYFVASSAGLYCNKCGKKHRAEVGPQEPVSVLVSLLGPFFAGAGISYMGLLPAVEELQCPDCKITWREIATTGRFGCAKDYEIFKDEISEWLLKIHCANRHKSK